MPSRAIVAKVETLACANAWRNYHFLKVTTEDGIVGWSEFDENFGSPGVSHIIGRLSHRLVGQSAHYHEHIREDLSNVTRPGAGGVVGQALGAIENALLDAKAKALGVPCHVLLGGKVRDRIRVYWSHCVSYRTRAQHFPPGVFDIEGVRAAAREVSAQGFTALKTNIFTFDSNGKIRGWAPGFGRPHAPGRNVGKDTLDGLRTHLSALRDSAGPGVDILLDLNFHAMNDGFLKILRGLEDFDLFWVELDTFDPRSLAYLRAHSRHPIASCESLIGVQEFLPFFREQAVDVAIVDVPWNGAWQSTRIAAVAAAFETNVACHNFYGHLCTMMNAHFCAVVPNLSIMETDIDRVASDAEIFTHAPEYVDGHLVLPDRPGWGTEPNEAVIAKYPPLPNVGMYNRTETPRLTLW